MAVHRKDLVFKYTCDAEAIELKIFQCDSGNVDYTFGLICIFSDLYNVGNL